jgi:hypothetical protein
MPTRALPLLRVARSAISLKPPDCPRKFAANSNKTRSAHAWTHSNRVASGRTLLNFAALKTAWKSSSIRTPAPQPSGSPAPSILAAKGNFASSGPTWSGSGIPVLQKRNAPKEKGGLARPAFRHLYSLDADVYIFNANVFFLISEVI